MSAIHGPLGQDDHHYRQMLANLEAAADAVEQGRIVTEQQLDELRQVIRRLRRGIDVYTLNASAPCPQCGDLYVPVVSTPPCCSDSRQEAGEDRSGRLRV